MQFCSIHHNVNSKEFDRAKDMIRKLRVERNTPEHARVLQWPECDSCDKYLLCPDRRGLEIRTDNSRFQYEFVLLENAIPDHKLNQTMNGDRAVVHPDPD